MCFYVFDLTEVKKEVEEGDEPRAETESESEEELSCFAPTVRTRSSTSDVLAFIFLSWRLNSVGFHKCP